MIKIGIIGPELKIFQAGKIAEHIKGMEVRGYYGEECSAIHKAGSPRKMKTYFSYETLLENIDAVIINAGISDSVATIGNCLRNFKHVFVIEAYSIRRDDFIQFQKLAEESNVVFYPVFGFRGIPVIEALSLYRDEIQFVDIRHSTGQQVFLSLEDFLSSLLLNDLTFLYEVIHANIQRVQANGWKFKPAESGMINARFDFDNGIPANLLVLTSGSHEDFQMILYARAFIVKVLCEGERFTIVKENISGKKIEGSKLIVTEDKSLEQELNLFYSCIANDTSATQRVEVRYKVMHTSFLVQEKINQVISSCIFPS